MARPVLDIQVQHFDSPHRCRIVEELGIQEMRGRDQVLQLVLRIVVPHMLAELLAVVGTLHMLAQEQVEMPLLAEVVLLMPSSRPPQSRMLAPRTLFSSSFLPLVLDAQAVVAK